MVDILEASNDSVSLFNSSLALPRDSDKSLKTTAKVIGRKYKSGALYYGKIEGNQRDGDGQLKWPSGIVYEGDYARNLRHGTGKHTWQDGSTYIGRYSLDSREGYGRLSWTNGEAFDGQFVNDKKNGKGKYSWSNGSIFEGYFRDDKKWGFGKFSYHDGTIFQGFYVNDVRLGPGILTYPSGKQDVGIWKGERLMVLCTLSENKFDLEHIKQHSINSAARRNFESTPQSKTVPSVIQTLSDELKIDTTEIVSQIPDNFDINSIVCGRREIFGPNGKLEVLSQELLEAASVGDLTRTKQILASKNISPNVSDFIGHFPLLSASVNCHPDIINVLLDYGADVNKLNPEGMSALSACHVLLYTEDIFINNLSENMTKENIFNAIEWDQQKGAVSLRNERQMILNLYEEHRVKSSRIYSAKKKSPLHHSFETLPSTPTKSDTVSPNQEEIRSESDSDSGLEQQKMNKNNWKFDYFQKTIDRIENLNIINKNFNRLPAMPIDYPHKMPRNLHPIDKIDLAVTSLKDVAQDEEDNNAGVSEKLSTSRLSMYNSTCFEATKVEACPRKLQILKRKLINLERKPHLEAVILLLLTRGADPNTGSVPLPALFYTVKTGNVKSVGNLLKRGANPAVQLENEKIGLTPLHIAAALPCREGIEITRLLLQAGGNPNARDNFFGNDEEGRTPLHIACCREDNYKESRAVIELLLSSNADPNLICHGHSPLTLAISSGNDLAIDTLLRYKANPSLLLPPGVGSALCVAASFCGERRRKASDRLKLIDKLVKAGADLLAPVLYTEKLGTGTVVDYAYHVFAQDRRIAHTPYHALNAAERECHNSRKEMLEHLGELLRTAALRRENEIIQTEVEQILESNNVYNTTKSAVTFDLPDKGRKETWQNKRPPNCQRSLSQGSGRDSSKRPPDCGLRFAPTSSSKNKRAFDIKRKFKYCYECGRSVGLRLNACSRCKEVFFCSKQCKLKAWAARHKDECTRIAESASRSSKSPYTELPPISKRKHNKSHRVNNYTNSAKYCICDLKKPKC